MKEMGKVVEVAGGRMEVRIRHQVKSLNVANVWRRNFLPYRGRDEYDQRIQKLGWKVQSVARIWNVNNNSPIFLHLPLVRQSLILLMKQ